MPALGFLHCRELLGAGRALIGRLPSLVGHAIDGLAALVLAETQALGVGFLFHPVRQAIAAEAGEIHQVDILDVATRAQMLDQPPENRRFKFRSGFVVDRHLCAPQSGRRFVTGILNITWASSRILPYRGVDRTGISGISAADCTKRIPRPLTAKAGTREIVKESI